MKRLAFALAVSVIACTVGDIDDDDLPEADEEKDPAPLITAAFGPCVNPNLTTVGSAVSLHGMPAWVHFTNPASSTLSKENITDEVVRLIWSVPSGGKIHAAIHSLSVDKVAHALVCAQKERGVTVKVVEDGGIATPRKDMSNAARHLEGGLPSDHLTYCGQGTDHEWSCIQKGKKAIMHTKMFLFSTATAPDGKVANNVVWFGSANMTKATGQNSLNNTVTVYGDAQLYQGALGYYRDLQAKKNVADDDYFNHGGKVVAPSARLFLSPSPTTDLWKDRLDQVIPGADCAIVVAHAYILDTRSVVVQKLRSLANKGCTVKVIGPKKDTKAEQDKQFSPSMLAVLDGKPSAGVPKIETRIAKIHEKYMIVHARFGEQPTVVRDFVFTGSHNLTGPANNKNDELLARLDGNPVAAAFFLHFVDTWNAATPVN